jgi:hypothetical protein
MIRKRIVGKQSLGLLLVFHEAMSITTACHLDHTFDRRR